MSQQGGESNKARGGQKQASGSGGVSGPQAMQSHRGLLSKTVAVESEEGHSGSSVQWGLGMGEGGTQSSNRKLILAESPQKRDEGKEVTH